MVSSGSKLPTWMGELLQTGEGFKVESSTGIPSATWFPLTNEWRSFSVSRSITQESQPWDRRDCFSYERRTACRVDQRNHCVEQQAQQRGQRPGRRGVLCSQRSP